jgi:hypothetical protein
VIGFEQAEVRDVSGVAVGCQFDFMRPIAHSNRGWVRWIAGREDDYSSGALLNDGYGLRT